MPRQFYSIVRAVVGRIAFVSAGGAAQVQPWTTWDEEGAEEASASGARGRGYVSASAFTTYRASRPPTAPSYP